MRPDEGVGTADVLPVVTPEAFCEAGNVAKLLGRYFLPGLGIDDFSRFSVLRSSVQDDRRWFFLEDGSQDDVFVFDAEREVGSLLHNLSRGLMSGDYEVDVDVSGRVGIAA